MPAITDTGNILIRIFKRAVGNPGYEWSNTYELHLVQNIGVGDWQTVLQDYVDAEKTIHTDAVEYVRAVAATWENDSTPYNPNSFVVRDFSGVFGTRGGATTYLPRSICLVVKRQTSVGRSGKIFYRGALTEADLDNPTSLFPTLASAAVGGIQTILDAMYADMQTTLVDHGDLGNSMALLGFIEGVGYFRDVSAFTVRGISMNDPDHKYFDRA